MNYPKLLLASLLVILGGCANCIHDLQKAKDIQGAPYAYADQLCEERGYFWGSALEIDNKGAIDSSKVACSQEVPADSPDTDGREPPPPETIERDKHGNIISESVTSSGAMCMGSGDPNTICAGYLVRLSPAQSHMLSRLWHDGQVNACQDATKGNEPE